MICSGAGEAGWKAIPRPGLTRRSVVRLALLAMRWMGTEAAMLPRDEGPPWWALRINDGLRLG